MSGCRCRYKYKYNVFDIKTKTKTPSHRLHTMSAFRIYVLRIHWNRLNHESKYIHFLGSDYGAFVYM